MIKSFFITLALIGGLATALWAQDRQTEHVFLITFDGLRWQELFGGADDSLTFDTRFVDDTAALAARFWADTPEERRQKLMPFFWRTIARQGQLLGNRYHGNHVDLTNPHWFSYPGYNEILTGAADPRIDSNDKLPNPNMTVLEWLNQQPELRGRVAAFASWDVFPYIINEERSGVPVNAGFEKASHSKLSPREEFLNVLQDQIPSPWGTVRLDAFTHHYALEYVRQYHPRVVYIAYGETDDFAHDGAYDQYLKSAYQTDQWIEDLWTYVQRDPVYRGKTTFLITTDHGRGDDPKREWTSHGSQVDGAQAVWLAAMGPDVPARGEVMSPGQHFQNQTARTLAWLLGYEYRETQEAGEPYDIFER